jgi:hypothetical protein
MQKGIFKIIIVWLQILLMMMIVGVSDLAIVSLPDFPFPVGCIISLGLPAGDFVAPILNKKITPPRFPKEFYYTFTESCIKFPH